MLDPIKTVFGAFNSMCIYVCLCVAAHRVHQGALAPLELE